MNPFSSLNLSVPNIPTHYPDQSYDRLESHRLIRVVKHRTVDHLSSNRKHEFAFYQSVQAVPCLPLLIKISNYTTTDLTMSALHSRNRLIFIPEVYPSLRLPPNYKRLIVIKQPTTFVSLPLPWPQMTLSPVSLSFSLDHIYLVESTPPPQDQPSAKPSCTLQWLSFARQSTYTRLSFSRLVLSAAAHDTHTLYILMIDRF